MLQDDRVRFWTASHVAVVVAETSIRPQRARAPPDALGIDPLECAAATSQIDEATQPFPAGRCEMLRMWRPIASAGPTDPVPRAMHDGRCSIHGHRRHYPSWHSPASARVRLLPESIAEVEVAASDMGPGTYTSMTQVSADMLGVPVERIRLQPGARNSTRTAARRLADEASTGSRLRRLHGGQAVAARRAVADQRSPVFGAALDGVEWHEGRLRRRGDSVPGQPYGDIVSSIGLPIEASGSAHPGSPAAIRSHSFGAVFVEARAIRLRMSARSGCAAAPRSAPTASGGCVNPRLASSQCTGGMIGGIGMALMERTVLDRGTGARSTPIWPITSCR